jgi:hypothetical protein
MTLTKQVSFKVYCENLIGAMRIRARLICNTSSAVRMYGAVLHVGIPGHRVYHCGQHHANFRITERCGLPTVVNLLATNSVPLRSHV